MSNTPKPPELDASVMELDEYETVQQKLALLSSKAYDVIKALVQIVIPATSAAYFSLGSSGSGLAFRRWSVLWPSSRHCWARC